MKQHGIVQPNGIDKKAVYAREARADMPRDNLKPASAGTENRGPKENQKSAQQHGTKTHERK